MSASQCLSIEPPNYQALPSSTPNWRRMAKFVENPLSLYTEEYFHLPIIKGWGFGRKVIHVMAPGAVQEVLQSENYGRADIVRERIRPILGNGLFTAEGTDWKKQRQAASPAFRAKALEALIPTFDAVGRATAERMATSSGDLLEIRPEMTRATLEVIIETLLKGDGALMSVEELGEDTNVIVESIGRARLMDFIPFVNFPPDPNVQDVVARIKRKAATIVNARMSQEDPGSDLMGLLIKARDEGGEGLSAENLVDNVLTFLGAGHETTALTLAWALCVLSKSAELQEALAEEADRVIGDGPVTADTIKALDLHERVIKEILRLYPPVPAIPRRVMSPTKLCYMDLDVGDAVLIGVYPMHRHQDLWNDPSIFDPDRFLPERDEVQHRYQWLPFGGGPRVCIGLRMAMMEAVVILARISQKVRFSPPDGPDPVPHLTATLRPNGPMPLHISRRN